MPKQRNNTNDLGTESLQNSQMNSYKEDLIKNMLDPSVLEALAKALIPAIMVTMEKWLQDRLKPMESMQEDLKSETGRSSQRITKLESELTRVNEELLSLKAQASKQDAYSRRDNLLFFGIPVQSYSDLGATEPKQIGASFSSIDDPQGLSTQFSNSQMAADLVIKLCQKSLNVDIQPSDISIAHRLPIARTGLVGGGTPILVKFTSRRVRDLIYTSRKSLKGTKIFINEHLSPETAHLFRETRNKIKDKKITSAWTNNGQIFFKVSSNASERPTPVRSISDLPR